MLLKLHVLDAETSPYDFTYTFLQYVYHIPIPKSLEFKFNSCSNPACGVSEICNGVNI